MNTESQKQLGKGSNTIGAKILISKRNSALKGAGATTVTYDENEHNVMSPPRDTLSFGFKGAPLPRPGNMKGGSNNNQASSALMQKVNMNSQSFKTMDTAAVPIQEFMQGSPDQELYLQFLKFKRQREQA